MSNMCNCIKRDEIQELINKALEEKFSILIDMMHKDYNPVAQSISGLGADLSKKIENISNDVKNQNIKIDEHIQRTEGDTEMRDLMKEFVENYKAFTKVGTISSKFIKGFGGFVLSIGAIYIFFEHIIKHFAK